MTWFGATNRSISPPSSFVAQPGFTVTPVSSFGDTLAYTVSRSSGSFGTHTNFNKTGSLTWNGFTYLCFLAKHWENQTLNANIDSGQLIEGMERCIRTGEPRRNG